MGIPLPPVGFADAQTSLAPDRRAPRYRLRCGPGEPSSGRNSPGSNPRCHDNPNHDPAKHYDGHSRRHGFNQLCAASHDDNPISDASVNNDRRSGHLDTNHVNRISTRYHHGSGHHDNRSSWHHDGSGHHDNNHDNHDHTPATHRTTRNHRRLQ